MLLISSLTALYGQTGDSLTCYTNQELQKIAKKLVQANEYETLLKITNKQLTEKDTAIVALKYAIHAKDSIIQNKQDIILLKDNIITVKDNDIATLTNDNTKLKKQKKFFKIAFSTTGSLLLGAIAAFFIAN